MVAFTDLVEFDPNTLRDAALHWRTVGDELTDQRAALGSQVMNRLRAPTWEGAAADAAQAHIGALSGTVDRTSVRFRSVGDTLDTAADGFAMAKAAVRELAAAAEGAGLLVGPDGSVRVNPAAVPDGPDRAARLSSLTATAARIDGGIKDVLRSASDLDNAVAMSLQENGFTGDGTDGPDAGTGSAAGDASRAAELASKGPLTEQELVELNGLFAAHAGDPVFATMFYGELGPAGTIRFLGVLTMQGGAVDAGQAAVFGDLQRQLGSMLSLATDPNGEPSLGSGWTDQLLASAGSQVDVGGACPTGFQLLGVLLLNDEVVYPTDFLSRFGDAAMAYEGGNSSAWAVDANFSVRLNFMDDTSTGWDPMTGLLSAMGNNGEASTAFFDPTAEPGRIEYLLEDRAPLTVDVDFTFDPQNSPYTNELGNALDSATTIDHDDPEASGTHSPAQASIMTETVRVLGSPEHLYGDIPDGMRDSVGNMVADYIADVNHAMEAKNSEGSLLLDENGQPTALFREESVLGLPAEARALFNTGDLVRVLDDAAHDPNAYVTMYDAERAYTVIALDHIASDDVLSQDQRANAVESEAQNSAAVFGVLDAARADAITEGGEAADQAYNDALGSARSATKWVIGELTSKIPVPGADTGISWMVDELFGLAEQDSSEATSREVAELYGDGRAQAADLAFQAMWNNGLWPEEYPPPDILLPDGEPADLSTLTDEQRAAMEEWKGGIGYDTYMGDVLQDIDSSYSTGEDRNDEATGEP